MKTLKLIFGVTLVLALTACGEDEQQQAATQAEANKQQTLEKVEKLKETTNDGQRF